MKKRSPNNPTNERMMKILLFKELEISTFAARVGKTRQNISQMLHRDTTSSELLKLMMEMYPDVNFKWIKTGHGCPFNCETAAKVTEHDGILNRHSEMIERLEEDSRKKDETIQRLTKLLSKLSDG